MKTHHNTLMLLPALIAGLILIPASRVTAQTFTTFHGFTATVVIDNGHFTFRFTNSDGVHPYAGVIPNSSGTILYGTTFQGGSLYYGTVFAVNINGTGFANLHTFDNTNGGAPVSGLTLSGSTLYGTASSGGAGGVGTVFVLHTDGTGFTNLYSFTGGSDGGSPRAGLILSGNALYGTAQYGGSADNGTVFTVNTDGTGFTNLHSFTATSDSYPYANSDGAHPYAALVLSDNRLYGTASAGGGAGQGTVFAVNTDGTGFTNLHTFTARDASSYPGTNSEGTFPYAGLILSGDTLYGTASGGGAGGVGTVFALHTDGTGFANLHNFDNTNGNAPVSGLTLSGNALYGTASQGGRWGSGMVFALNTDGTGFTNLHNFSPLIPDTVSVIGASTNTDGAKPNAGLLLSGNTLYGTAAEGDSGGNGTVFSLSLLRPQLTIAISRPFVILTWPANEPAAGSSGFRVQATLGPVSFTEETVWTDVAVPPAVSNGQCTITMLDGIFETRRFYRLKSL